jgi:hypothetical protein
MATSLQDLVTRVYTQVGTTEALATDKWSPAQVIDAMNLEWQVLRHQIRQEAPDLLVTSAATTLTKDTAYTLPANFVQLIDVSYTVTKTPLFRISNNDDAMTRSWRYIELQGNDMYLRFLDTAEVTITYLKDYGDLHYGTCAGEELANSTTLWLANAAANATGTVVNTADYYNGLRLMIHAGTGAGQIRTVTDHGISGGFSYVTTAAWSPKPDATTEYGFLPPNFEPFEGLLIWGALARSPLTGYSQAAQNSPIFAELRANFAQWLRRQQTGGRNAHRDMNTQFSQAYTGAVNYTGVLS